MRPAVPSLISRQGWNWTFCPLSLLAWTYWLFVPYRYARRFRLCFLPVIFQTGHFVHFEFFGCDFFPGFWQLDILSTCHFCGVLISFLDFTECAFCAVCSTVYWSTGSTGFNFFLGFWKLRILRTFHFCRILIFFGILQSGHFVRFPFSLYTDSFRDFNCSFWALENSLERLSLPSYFHSASSFRLSISPVAR